MTTPVSEVPGTESDVTAQIPAMDFAVDDKESLHVVWRSVLNDRDQPGLNQDKFSYIRGNLGGATWTKPILLADNGLADNIVRVLIAPDALHILFGRNLRHLVSNNSGQSWHELAPLIPNEETRADVFDATVVDDRLVVAYLDHPVPPYEKLKGNQNGEQRLYVVRWSATGCTPPLEIASFPKSMFEPPTPRLIAEGKRLHLMFGLNTERLQGEKGGSIKGRLFYLRSVDGGSTWPSPIEPTLGVGQGVTAVGTKGGIQSIRGIELLLTQRGLYAFYRESSLFVISTVDGLSWRPAVEIAPAKQGLLSANFHSASASVASTGDNGWLAWIDTRFRKSNRHWWNPLGGIPWSDDPDWANNDIFALPLSEVVALSTGAAQSTASDLPSRLTESLSYANTVRMGASPKRFFLLWSGRRKVGKELQTFGEKPKLFWTTLSVP